MKVNKHTSHPSVFISSTFIDLQEERESVADALHSRGLIINALDTKPTSNNTSTREIIDGIKESDFVVLIIGDRYGSVLKTMTGSYSKSITSWEYEIGIACGKPVIAYFKDGESSDPKNHDDPTEPTYGMKRHLFEQFKKEISAKHNPAYFFDPYDLSEKVKNALIPTYRNGVKTLNLEITEMTNKITDLENQIQKLTITQSNTSATSNLLGLGGLKNKQ